MAANKPQGSYFGVFLTGAALLSAGIGWFGSAFGKLLLVAGIVVLLVSMGGFLKIKPLEGDTPLTESPGAMKLVGALVALAGWVVTIGGMHVVDGNGGRIVVALIGIGLSLFGMLVVLPAAFNKNAFWKMPARGSRPVAMMGGSASKASLDANLTSMEAMR
jgi:hypothetical protein